MLRLHPLLLLPLAFGASLLVGLWVAFFAERLGAEGRVLSNVIACGQLIEGQRAEDLPQVLSPCSDRIENAPVSLRLGDAVLSRSAAELGILVDWPALARLALRRGREGTVFGQFGFWISHLRRNAAVEVPLAVTRAQLESAVAPWVETQVEAPKAPTLSLTVPPSADYGAPGHALDLSLLEARLKGSWLGDFTEQRRDPIDVPLVELPLRIGREIVDEQLGRARALLSRPITVTHPEAGEPLRISPQELATVIEVTKDDKSLTLTLPAGKLRELLSPWLKDLEISAKNADFSFGSGGRVTIAPSEEGRTVDLERLGNALLRLPPEGDRRVGAELIPVRPRLTTSQAQALRVKKLVASFTTVHECCQPRVDNIHVAADRVDGTVLRPGERFSLNDVLGPRTGRAGYKQAPTIVHGEMEETWGGGVSQFATTLFNAVLDGGYQIIQRQPHSFYFSRYPEGHEATVSFPEPDLIFRNDTEAGLVIKTHYSGTFIKVLLYGDNGGRRVRRQKSKRYDVVKPDVIYEPDDSLDPEKPKRLYGGQLGWTVLVSRIIDYPDGRVSTEKREVVYRSRPMIVKMHPCKIPEGEEGASGEECPEPEDEFADEPREFEDVGYWEDPRGEGAYVFESEE